MSSIEHSMILRTKDATHWRDRGEELRVLADEMSDAEPKEMMLRLAEDYERRAQQLEGRDGSEKVTQPRRGATTGLYRDPHGWAALSHGLLVERKKYVESGYAPPYDDLPTQAEYDCRPKVD
jgi:hypothetical protein